MSDATIAIRLVPRSGRDAIVGERDGRVLIRVAAPPVDGRANEAVCRLVADRLGVPRSAVAVARGRTSRDKELRVEGIGTGVARCRLLGG